MNTQYTEGGININTYDLLFPSNSESDNLSILNQIDSIKWGIIKAIEGYTTINDKSITGIIQKLFYQKLKDKKICNISYNKEDKQYYYNDNENNFGFKKYSDVVNDELKRELLSFKRYGKCHEMSLLLATNIKGSTVVTGYINIDSVKVLHSVIKIFRSGDSYILDYTKNIMMKEKQYLELYGFKAIAIIPGTVIKSDYKKISGKIAVGQVIYTVFRDEIIKDMQKNMVFNNNSSFQKK